MFPGKKKAGSLIQTSGGNYISINMILTKGRAIFGSPFFKYNTKKDNNDK